MNPRYNNEHDIPVQPADHRADPHENDSAPRNERRRPDLEELITLAELADLLRIPQATLRYWRHLGTGPDSFKIGRHVRYRGCDVDAWLRRQRGTGGPDAA